MQLPRLRFGLVLLAAAPLVAAGCNPAAGLQGKWQVDQSALNNSLSRAPGQKLTKGAAKLAWVAGSSLTMEFKADGTCSAGVGFLGQTNSLSGDWRFIKQDGKALVIGVKMEDDTEERELRVTVIDDDHLEMPLPMQIPGVTSQNIPFVRKLPE